MKIFIYFDRPCPSLSIDELRHRFEKSDFEVIFKGNLIESLNLNQEDVTNLANKISGAIIDDVSVPNDEIVFPGHRYLDSERKKLAGEADYMGVFYDGYWLQRIFFNLFSDKLVGTFANNFPHIIFTGRLFGTFEKRRYHARVILMGAPNLISTSGVVEAPARPSEYYWLKAGFIQSGRDIAELDSIYRGKFIEYNDSRMTPILGSYALQAVAYAVSGKEFCDDKTCCLYNSHWQQEVLRAQLDGKFCHIHREIMSNASVKNQLVSNKKD